jgi:hypothetical protein
MDLCDDDDNVQIYMGRKSWKRHRCVCVRARACVREREETSLKKVLQIMGQGSAGYILKLVRNLRPSMCEICNRRRTR